MKNHKFIQVNNRNVNATWVATKTEAEFLDYGKKVWAEHPDMKGKTAPQQEAFLKNIYNLAKEAVRPESVVSNKKKEEGQ
jgi:hypothetical protein